MRWEWKRELWNEECTRRAIWRPVFAWVPRRVTLELWVWMEWYEVRHVYGGSHRMAGVSWLRETRPLPDTVAAIQISSGVPDGLEGPTHWMREALTLALATLHAPERKTVMQVDAILEELRGRRGFRHLLEEIQLNDVETWEDLRAGLARALAAGRRVAPLEKDE